MNIELARPMLRKPAIARLRRPVLAAAIAIVGIIGLYGGLLAAAKPLLGIPTRIEHADMIVVLGGDAGPRAAVAAELFKAGMAPRVLVTGDGDCQDNRQVLLDNGVPPGAILVECDSRNTMENAEFSAAIMRRMAVHRVLLVTSWYHSRRALGCFQKVAPATAFMPVSASQDQSVWRVAGRRDGYRIAAEYLKIGWYLLRYNVAPASALPKAARMPQPS